jgi:hypothetical protein
MGIFKKKKKVPAAIGSKGQPVYVNPPANADSRLKRNLIRIEKCKFYMSILDPVADKEMYESWKKEHDRRTAFVASYKP